MKISTNPGSTESFVQSSQTLYSVLLFNKSEVLDIYCLSIKEEAALGLEEIPEAI